VRAINLIPSDQRAGGRGVAGRSGGAAYVILGGLAGLVLMGVIYLMANHQAADRAAQTVSVSQQADAASARATALMPYTQFATLRASRVQAVSSLVAAREDWARHLTNVTSVLPSAVQVQELDGSVAAATSSAPSNASTAAPTAPAGTSATIVVTGCALTQTQAGDVIQRLRAIRGVLDVSLATSVKGETGAAPASAATATTATTGTAAATTGAVAAPKGCVTSLLHPTFKLSVFFGTSTLAGPAQ
jgi:hypothetical protein